MSSGTTFLRAALMELNEAFEYYERREAGLGERFDAEVTAACEEILRDPQQWRERAGGYRRVNLAVFPYYIIYFISGERVFIAAVAHSSRHPEYWKPRMK